MTIYSPERQWPRLIPQGTIMVAIFDAGLRQAYGMLSDISLGGARIVSETELEPNRDVLLRIRFDGENAPFSTPAAIMWAEDDSEIQNRKSFVYGIRFLFGDDQQKAQLREVLEARIYSHLVVPGHIPSQANGMNGLGSEAAPEESQKSEVDPERVDSERRRESRLKL